MKKLIILLILLNTTAAYSQWVSKVVDNKLDEPYRIAYCVDGLKRAVLKLEVVGDQLSFYLSGNYFCDDLISVDIGLIVNGESKRYTIEGVTSSDAQSLFLVDNILAPEQSDLLRDFKNCTSAVVRVNETHCDSDIFKFNMSGSTKAITFMMPR